MDFRRFPEYTGGTDVGSLRRSLDVAEAGSALLPLAAVIIVLALLGGVGWLVLRRRRGPSGTPSAVPACADAACPACFTVAAIGHVRE